MPRSFCSEFFKILLIKKLEAVVADPEIFSLLTSSLIIVGEL